VNLGKGYFPEEEEHIAAYLNLQFYKFIAMSAKGAQ
jgi:hypothetical protein